MTLKELQSMIKEEFEAYTNEAEDDVDVSVSDNDIDAEMGDEMDNAGEEDVLRSIFDLLKTHFEGGEEEMGDEMPDMGDEEGDDMGEMPMEGAEDELEENATTSAQFQKTGMAAGGAGKGGTGYDAGSVGGKGRTGYDAKSIALQERFQKLANIIK
tara:strand:+ start:172 stop:639 length:468 start_codon:yes stop_codon:yes gene_type:complete